MEAKEEWEEKEKEKGREVSRRSKGKGAELEQTLGKKEGDEGIQNMEEEMKKKSEEIDRRRREKRKIKEMMKE